jgi:hypothetical protein
MLNAAIHVRLWKFLAEILSIPRPLLGRFGEVKLLGVCRANPKPNLKR